MSHGDDKRKVKPIDPADHNNITTRWTKEEIPLVDKTLVQIVRDLLISIFYKFYDLTCATTTTKLQNLLYHQKLSQ
jgi:hypothetical protein